MATGGAGCLKSEDDVKVEPGKEQMRVKQEPGMDVKPDMKNDVEKPLCTHCKVKTAYVPSLEKEEEFLCCECNLKARLDRYREVCQMNTKDLTPRNKEFKKWQSKAHTIIPYLTKSRVPLQGQKSSDVHVLQPTMSDIILLESLAPDLPCLLRKCSLKQFLQILWPKVANPTKGDHLKGTLFDNYDEPGKNLTKFKDQRRRANRLVTEMKKRQLKKLYLLDGHGRTLLCILRAMSNKGMNLCEMSIVVVDIDKQCDSFHKYFFPSVIETKCEDICRVQITESDMVYLNFCSISPRTEDIFHNKEEVLKVMWEWMKTVKGIMISTIIRSKKKRKTRNKDQNKYFIPGPRVDDNHHSVKGFQKTLEDKKLFGARKVASRNRGAANEFKTWFISSEHCEAKESPNALKKWFEDNKVTWDYRLDIVEGAYVYVDKGKNKSNSPKLVTKRTPSRAILEKKISVDIKQIRYPVRRRPILGEEEIDRLILAFTFAMNITP